MPTSVKSNRLKDVVFCKDPECKTDVVHAYFVFGNVAFYGSFRFELLGQA